MKRILTIAILSVCVMLCMTALTLAESVQSGECGDDLTWTLDGEGTLTISGTGRMFDWGLNDTPWDSKMFSIKKIVVEPGVTSIGNMAFYDCVNLLSVTIPNSVTSIGDSAFYSCKKLAEITIPEGVKYIGYRTFDSCTELSNISVLGTLNDIGYYAFYNTKYYNDVSNYENGGLYIGSNLITVMSDIGNSFTIKDGTKTIADSAFENCSSLAEISIPNSVVFIGEEAFNNTSYYNNASNWEDQALYIDDCLISVNSSKYGSYTINDGTRVIAGGAFSYCWNLWQIIIPNGVTHIGEYAFDRCSEITDMIIPDSVISIGRCAFLYCQGLTEITISEGVTSISEDTFRECSSLKEIIIPGSVTSIEAYAFCDCTSLKQITILDNVTEIGEYAIGWDYDIAGDSYSRIYGIIVIGRIGTSAEAYANKHDIRFVVFVDSDVTWNMDYDSGILTISGTGDMADWDYSFQAPWHSCSSVSKVVIESGVTSIGAYAFDGFRFLESITIPDSVTKIGDYAFLECDSLTSITIPDSVTNMGRKAFYNTAYYNNAENWENDVLYLGNYLLEASESITGEYTVKNGTKVIANEAFYECRDLTTVVIPDGAVSIGDKAFLRCYDLTSITIPDSVVSIGNEAFDKDGLFTICGYSDSKAELYAKENNKLFFDILNNSASGGYGDNLVWKLTADGVLTVSGTGEMFDEMWHAPWYSYISSIKTVIIESGVTSIDDHAFSDCSSLTSITIPDGITSIGIGALDSCHALTEVVIPNSVTSIGDYAFRYCESITSITIPDGVTSIGVHFGVVVA